MQFLQLLAKPESHVLVPTSQYVLNPSFTRTSGDMAAQMVQELVSLNPKTAYAKILSGKDGEEVRKPKITTKAPPNPSGGVSMEEAISSTRRQYCIHRDEIDAEIQRRRTAWREAARP